MIHARSGWVRCVAVLLCMAGAAPVAGEAARFLDLAAFGRLTAWPDSKATNGVELAAWDKLPGDARCAGVAWDEERDVREIRARFAGGADPGEVTVQYWYRTWPPSPPAMPTIEDPVDDEWRGAWLAAQTERAMRGGVCIFTFKPLDKEENQRAVHLPGVNYRRTLKARLVLPEGGPKLESLAVFSESQLAPISVRIEFGRGEKEPAVWSGSLEIHNGILESARPWSFEAGETFKLPFAWENVRAGGDKGVIANILASKPSPAGSNDLTVVTVRATAARDGNSSSRAFSFSTLDLERGPIYVPDLHVCVSRGEALGELPKGGKKIRDQIPQEPEQTFERATREIPPLDPWVRQHGDKVYLPVAADASWQKFAVEYGGDIYIHRNGTKAKGAERKRLRWKGDGIRFRFGTGQTQYLREDQKAKVSVADGYLPIVINRWERDGLEYEEEAFATLLQGPLDPNDPARSEQTPAVCMVQLKVRNPAKEPQRARIWFMIQAEQKLSLSDGALLGNMGAEAADPPSLLRAVLLPPQGADMRVTGLKEKGGSDTVLAEFDVPAGGTEVLYATIPFVSDIPLGEAAKLKALEYGKERDRVAKYWRELVSRTTRFSVPEPKFDAMARSVVPHVHISTTKDPKSGLYMVPAASYNYQVYANEDCFQAMLLDVLGDTRRAGQYLETLVKLQGTRSFPGNYVEPHDGVFHGARVDDEYDYTASDYGLDHGTVLWTLARHYFYTRDKAWLERTLPAMLKAIEWIERQRAATRINDLRGGRALTWGLLPAGHLEDNSDWGYWFSVNAYCVAGMVETAAAMREIGHADAEKVSTQAADFRECLRASVLRSTEQAPVTRMRDGTYSPYVPTRAGQRFRYFGPLRVQYYSRYGKPDVLPCYRLSATREVLYGPMILLNIGIFDVREPIANWILDDWEDNLTLSSSGGFNVHGFTDDRFWFSQGGMVFQSNLQNPIWVYLARREVPAAIRGLYNACVACLYPEVNTFTEEYRQWVHASGPFYKSPDEAKFVNRVRDCLVLESGEDLWLAGGVPQRWLTSKDGIRVERINSTFGPVAFSLKSGDKPGTLVARIEPPTRPVPRRLWLYARLPEGKQIKGVQLNGKEWNEFEVEHERVRIPADQGAVDVVIRF